MTAAEPLPPAAAAAVPTPALAPAAAARGRRRAALAVAGLPFAWLVLFFLVPFAIVVRLSFSQTVLAQPPYEPVLFDVSFAGAFDYPSIPAFLSGAGPDLVAFLSRTDGAALAAFAERLRDLSAANYVWLTQDPLYLDAYLSSLVVAAVSTALTLLVAYPFALGLARAPDRLRPGLLVLAVLPFWTSFLIRVYAWMGILGSEGFLNQGLLALGLIDRPLVILNTQVAVYIGIVYSYLPFMVLPIYASLERQDPRLLEAVADLGSTPLKAFWQVTFPLSLPGVAAGALLVFIPAVGEFVIPDLLGGSDTLMIGRTLWNEFFNNRDWPVASAVAVVLLVLLIVPILVLQRLEMREGGRR